MCVVGYFRRDKSLLIVFSIIKGFYSCHQYSIKVLIAKFYSEYGKKHLLCKNSLLHAIGTVTASTDLIYSILCM